MPRSKLIMQLGIQTFSLQVCDALLFFDRYLRLNTVDAVVDFISSIVQ
jgi:hypothetical protein